MYKVYQDWGANLLGPTAALPESELPEAGCAPEAVHGAGPSPASVLVLTELTELTGRYSVLGLRYGCRSAWSLLLLDDDPGSPLTNLNMAPVSY